MEHAMTEAMPERLYGIVKRVVDGYVLFLKETKQEWEQRSYLDILYTRLANASGAWQKYSYRRQYGIMRSRNSSLLSKRCSYVYHRCAVPRPHPRDTADRTITGLFGAACTPSDESPALGAPRR